MEPRLFDFQFVAGKAARQLFSASPLHAVIDDVRPLQGGMSTSNYLVTARGSSARYVLRIYPQANDHCALEAAAYRYAGALISVPRLYHVDTGKTLIPNSYLIMEYVDAPTLLQMISAKREFPWPLAFILGAALSLLHGREYPCMTLLDERLQPAKPLLPFP